MKIGGMVLLLFLALTTDLGAEVAVKVRAIPELHAPNSGTPFALGASASDFGKDRAREELELRAKPAGINLVATARATVLEQSKPEYQLIINEASYDFSLFGERFGVGKKILSWDVGFGFRPLDVIQQENRRAVFASTLEGVVYLAWEKYRDETAWMLVYVNPGEGKARAPKEDEALALKYYRHWDNTDGHAIVRVSKRNRVEAGTAFTKVALESFEWHGSLLYQQRYERLHNTLLDSPALPISSSDPLENRAERHGGKALLGCTWTGESGVSLLGEAWYDAGAYSAREWRAVRNLSERQVDLLGQGVPEAAVRGNIAYSSRYFERPNLLRESLLVRLSHRREGGSLEPALDILCTPADGGLVATASLGYESNRFRLDAGVRQFGGARNSAYRLLPEERIVYFAVQGFW